MAVWLPDPRAGERDVVPDSLTLGEREHAAALAPLRRVSWVGGRVALRLAAREFGWDLGTIEATPRGAPALPQGLAGSIAHKSRLAVALALASDSTTIGVDLEELDRPRPKIARLVLRPEERHLVDEVEPSRRWTEILVRFSLKEAIFKALDPSLQRYIGFQEARVTPRRDGTAHVDLSLRGGEGPFALDARWFIDGEHVIGSVCARPPPGV